MRHAVEERLASRRRGTAARASGRTRRRSRPGTRGRPRRRASGPRRSARPDGPSPGASRAGLDVAARAPASCPTRSTRRRRGRARPATTRGGTTPARGSAAPTGAMLMAGEATRPVSLRSPRVLVAGNWKMFKGAHQAREFATPDPARRRRTPRVSTSSSARRSSRSRRRSRASAPDSAHPRLRAERPLGARGRVHGRGLARRCCSSSASTGAIVGHSERRQLLRRDRRDGAPAGGGRARGRAPRHRLRRRDRGRARGRRDRGRARAAGRGDPAARAARDRVRARLGDRHRARRRRRRSRRRRTRSSSRCTRRRCSTAAR